MAQRIDMTGETYGDLTVIRYSHGSRHGAHWLCRCVCGKETTYSRGKLISGRVKSCGCGRVRKAKERAHLVPLRAIWNGMKYRCYNKQSTSYANYGGRGIRVCDRWLQSFDAFVEDMGPRPSPEHSIDRIDNDRDYTPDNCRWATVYEQARNTRKTCCTVEGDALIDVFDTLYIALERCRLLDGANRDRLYRRLVNRIKRKDTYRNKDVLQFMTDYVNGSVARRYIDITGERFGDIVAIRYICSNTTDSRWLCRCVCGHEREYYRSYLLHKKTFRCNHGS